MTDEDLNELERRLIGINRYAAEVKRVQRLERRRTALVIVDKLRDGSFGMLVPDKLIDRIECECLECDEEVT